MSVWLPCPAGCLLWERVALRAPLAHTAAMPAAPVNDGPRCRGGGASCVVGPAGATPPPHPRWRRLRPQRRGAPRAGSRRVCVDARPETSSSRRVRRGGSPWHEQTLSGGASSPVFAHGRRTPVGGWVHPLAGAPAGGLLTGAVRAVGDAPAAPWAHAAPSPCPRRQPHSLPPVGLLPQPPEWPASHRRAARSRGRRQRGACQAFLPVAAAVCFSLLWRGGVGLSAVPAVRRLPVVPVLGQGEFAEVGHLRRAGDGGRLRGRLVYGVAAPAVRAVPSRKGGGGPRHGRPALQQAFPTPDCATLLSASSSTCSMTVDTVGGIRG